MDVALALLAAFLFALGLVLQEKAASTVSSADVRAGFLIRLAHKPVWLLGGAAQVLGFVAQAIALGIGRMVIVQPLMIASIVFALPLSHVITKRHILRLEWLGAAIVTAGLAALLLVTKTDAGSDDAPFGRWALIGGGAIAVAAVLYVLARGRSSGARAAMLGTAGGILFGLAAGLTKTVASSFGDDVLHPFGSWQIYALAVVSVIAFWLQQAALQTGALAPAVATNMAFDALSSLLFGIVIFGEALHETTFGVILSVLALGLTLAGLVLLVRAKDDEPKPSAEPAAALSPS